MDIIVEKMKRPCKIEIKAYSMKISIFRLTEWLGWSYCLAMTWMAPYIYLTKDNPMGGIFCLLLGILFSLILIHLLLLRSYEQKIHQ